MLVAAMTVGELAFGLAAWILGLAALFLCRKKNTAQMCGLGSLTCCAISLCIVIFDFAYMADIEEISAFLDTANAFRLAAGVLLTVTLVLNAAALIVRRDVAAK